MELAPVQVLAADLLDDPRLARAKDQLGGDDGDERG